MALLIVVVSILAVLLFLWPNILAFVREGEKIKAREEELCEKAKKMACEQEPRVVIRKPAIYKSPDPIHTATFWWKRLFTPQGILGAILLPLWVPALLISTNFLSLALEIVTGSEGVPIWVVEVFGVEVEITFHNLFAGLLALYQAISGAIVKITSNNAANDPSLKERTWFKVLAISTLIALLASTVGISALKGYIVGGFKFAALNGVLYLCIALVDILCGGMVIGNLIIPFILALVYSLIAPWRWLLNLGKVKEGDEGKEEVRIVIPVRIERPKLVSSWYKIALSIATGLVYLLEPLMGKETSEARA